MKESLRVGWKQSILKIAQFFEGNDDEQFILYDQVDIMQKYQKDSNTETYGQISGRKMSENFGTKIITEVNWNANVIPLKSTANVVLIEFHTYQKEDPEAEKLNIIRMVAGFIRNDVK